MMLLFVGVGLLFTVRLKGVQFRLLGKALRLIRPGEGKDGVSPYAALCTALAATVGTGNIVGVATALASGGPGALLWMLLAAVFGMATQYAEGFLAVKFRRKEKNGWFGGPFCYIEQGLGRRFRWLAVTFAVTGAAVGILGVGTTAQVNSITGAADAFFSSGTAFVVAGHAYSKTVVISGALTTVAAALVLLGGVKRITAVCQALVPFMAALYLLFSAVLLICCADRIPAAIVLIVKSAFCPRAVLGAGAGVSLKLALRMGIGRGVFTNEAGLGSSAIAAAVSDETDPVNQGLISMTGTFIDTVVICTVTGLCLTVTGAWRAPLQGVQLTDAAWRAGLPWAESLSTFVLVVCLTFFAFATIIGWNFYAERCVCYLTGDRRWVQRIYRMFYLLAIAVGPYVTVNTAWELADVLNALMALPNLTALLLLQNQVVSDTLRAETKK
ncbi:MAG: sodium:alanine symporter family protein [Oscillospiraceae bacterium]|nr:sodium:alanine symporter family protein [Oscillospiraceae bacterium]